MTSKEKVDLLIKLARSFGVSRTFTITQRFFSEPTIGEEHRIYLLMNRPLDKMAGDKETSKFSEHYMGGEEMVEVKITSIWNDEISISSKSYQHNMYWDGKRWIEEEDYSAYWFEKVMEELIKLSDWTVSEKLKKWSGEEYPRNLEEAEQWWDR